MSGLAKAVKLISFKLQDGKTQQEAVKAMRGIIDYFSQQPGAMPSTVMHDPESDTYYVFAPADSLEVLKTDGRAMVASGAGDTLFAIVDPPTFKPINCVVLDV